MSNKTVQLRNRSRPNLGLILTFSSLLAVSSFVDRLLGADEPTLQDSPVLHIPCAEASFHTPQLKWNTLVPSTLFHYQDSLHPIS